mgnify:CR=1 FL=1
MGNEENKAPMAEKIDLTPVEVDPSLSDEAEFGKPDNDSKSYCLLYTSDAADD